MPDHVCHTSDGTEIRLGLRVLDYDRRLGMVAVAPDAYDLSDDVCWAQAGHNGHWWGVCLDVPGHTHVVGTCRGRIFDGSRLTTRGVPPLTDPVAEFEAQDRLQPGQEGWWRVWGAHVRHIRPGDIVLSKTEDGVDTDYIEDVYLAKNYPLRWGVIIKGQRLTFGALTNIVLVRRSTHNILAED